ncbi:diguanylate cyclase domain-containing protein [Marinobacter gelidimuriae]|uniref:diguanylate cyclase domain-containing protein n=1 Tax=Marinobacter gelidimuriae TaxID=2739064 RepID=UPI000361CD83|nr:diguanylate cyclase [Marinobacter gelidimuriae]
MAGGALAAGNDRTGHHTGDTVLTGIARLLSNRLRDNDHIFRIGGEEFMVLLPETSLPEAEILAFRATAEPLRRLPIEIMANLP